MVGVGGVADHGDVGINGSGLGLENQLVPDSEIPPDRAVGNFEFARLALDVLCDVSGVSYRDGFCISVGRQVSLRLRVMVPFWI